MAEIEENKSIEEQIREHDSLFLSSVFMLADEWAVKIISIDLENRVLDFDCKDEDRHPFVKKLLELFGDSLE